jgi:hypothetical protein
MHDIDTPLAYNPAELRAYPSGRLCASLDQPAVITGPSVRKCVATDWNFQVLKAQLAYALHHRSRLRKYYYFVPSIAYRAGNLYCIDL